MAIKCGRSHGYHESVADVRKCFDGQDVPIVPDPRAVGTDGKRGPDASGPQIGFAKALLNERRLRYIPGVESLDRRTISDVIGLLKSGGRLTRQYESVPRPIYCEKPQCPKQPTMTITNGRRTSTFCLTHGSQVQSGDFNNRFTYATIPFDERDEPTEAKRHPGAPAKETHSVVSETDDNTTRWVTKPKAPAFDTETLEDGFYALPIPSAPGDFHVFKVIVAVHGSGRKYAKKLNTETGEWEHTPGRIRDLRPEMRMNLQQALAVAKSVATNVEGRLYGRCFVCGRTLTREDSIDRMMGSVCAGKFGE
jgi:hypothetical protein